MTPLKTNSGERIVRVLRVRPQDRRDGRPLGGERPRDPRARRGGEGAGKEDQGEGRQGRRGRRSLRGQGHRRGE